MKDSPLFRFVWVSLVLITMIFWGFFEVVC